ncbi:MAG: hypothetical protein M3546_17055 [Actinomycetota bacterium]|nr:hypothetical protein [Actinomycetota bacterium]
MSRLVAPGGFTAVMNIASPIGVDDPFCTFCSASAPVWLHLASSRVVCRHCLPDPRAEEGEAGRQAARRLAELDRQEDRVRQMMVSEGAVVMGRYPGDATTS